MKYFDKTFHKFFKDLYRNNDREWFKSNKSRYESAVKEPFERFITDALDAVQKIDPAVTLTPKESIFRIYRDTRFSKDKTPYKLQASASISRGGKKDMTDVGLYLQFGKENNRFYTGCYMPDSKMLQKIREHLMVHHKTFDRILSGKAFKSHFGEIVGEKNKRIPKEFREFAEKYPMMMNKQFYAYSDIKNNDLYSDNLLKLVTARYKATMKLADFFRTALAK